MEWISVEDRLPETWGSYLIYIPGGVGAGDGSILTARWFDIKQQWKAAQQHAIFQDVTHWMPLPTPPTQSEKLQEATTMPDTTIELKPCPFCGGNINRKIGFGGLNFFKCSVCGATVSFDNDFYNTHTDEAVNAWNTRT